MEPKSNDWSPYKKRTEHRRTGKGQQRPGAAAPSQGLPGPTDAVKRQGKILPYRLPGEHSHVDTLGSVSSLWHWENKSLLKPPSLWYFVMAARDANVPPFSGSLSL